jgi:hypothetical protein
MINTIAFFKKDRLIPVKAYPTAFSNCLINHNKTSGTLVSVKLIFEYIRLEQKSKPGITGF